MTPSCSAITATRFPTTPLRFRSPASLFRRTTPIVSVLRLNGVIASSGMPMRQNLHLAGLAEAIQRAFETKGAKAVALAINSPGGSPVQSALIAGRIRALAKEKDLPVYSFVEDVAASGGYWLACAGDEIFADRSSIVGSIGVIAAGFGFVEAIRKLGIERRVYTEGDHKTLLDPFRPEDQDDVKRLKALQREIHDSFKLYVQERRGRRLKGEDRTLFNGDIWTGQGALEHGLIDGLGDLRNVMRDRFGDKVRFRVANQPKGWLRRRVGFAAAGAGEEAVSAVLGTLEARAAWARFGL